ncbi:hypothetical protein HY086_01320 [Candidatus Gottesmanbacteria bacterium]|nr:hypothetical protein [Candidatus Gottesmanbacteria bacterium]
MSETHDETITLDQEILENDRVRMQTAKSPELLELYSKLLRYKKSQHTGTTRVVEIKRTEIYRLSRLFWKHELDGIYFGGIVGELQSGVTKAFNPKADRLDLYDRDVPTNAGDMVTIIQSGVSIYLHSQGQIVLAQKPIVEPITR